MRVRSYLERPSHRGMVGSIVEVSFRVFTNPLDMRIHQVYDYRPGVPIEAPVNSVTPRG